MTQLTCRWQCIHWWLTHVFCLYSVGGERFLKDIESMLGYRPGKIWIYSWKYIAPIALLVGLYTHPYTQGWTRKTSISDQLFVL